MIDIENLVSKTVQETASKPIWWFFGTCGMLNRVTTCLENLEMSGNLTAVREMSGILLKIRELSGKKSSQGKVA